MRKKNETYCHWCWVQCRNDKYLQFLSGTEASLWWGIWALQAAWCIKNVSKKEDRKKSKGSVNGRQKMSWKAACDKLHWLSHACLHSGEFGTRKTTYRKICCKLYGREQTSEEYWDAIPLPQVHPEFYKSSGRFPEVPTAPFPENRGEFCFHLQR